MCVCVCVCVCVCRDCLFLFYTLFYTSFICFSVSHQVLLVLLVLLLLFRRSQEEAEADSAMAEVNSAVATEAFRKERLALNTFQR